MSFNHLFKTTWPARTNLGLIFAGLVTAYAGAPAQAGDGRLEINQVCAANDGCFSGDSPGFPVEVVDAGSYVLTSNLDLPADTSGIDLQAGAHGSMIDLNGFAIRGPESCDGTPVTSCSSEFTYDVNGVSGVDLDASTLIKDVTVVNGSVSGMSGAGVLLGARARVLRVTASENTKGVNVNYNSTLKLVTARRNLGSGVFAQSGSTLVDTKVLGNGGTAGMRVFDDSTVIRSTAMNNADQGFQVSNGSVLKQSVSAENGGDGVVANEAAVADITSTRNGGDGINCNSAAVKGAVITGNADDSLGVGCVEVGSNLCGGDTNC